MTGFSEIMETKQAYDLGANEFLLKPFDRDSLNTIVEGGLGTATPKQTTEAPKEVYCSVSIDHFISGRQSPTDIYIRLSDQKYIMIARKDTPLDIKRGKITKQGLTEFHVRKDDFKLFGTESYEALQAA